MKDYRAEGVKKGNLGNDNNAEQRASENIINEASVPEDIINDASFAGLSKLSKPKESEVATMISQLPPQTIAALLVANHQAELEGDHRSLLNLKKLLPLLKEVSPIEYKSQKIAAKAKHAHITEDVTNPEALAEVILKLSGIQGKGRLMSEDLRARYPRMNKAELVSLGANNLKKMLMAFDDHNNAKRNEVGIYGQDFTNIDIFNTFMRQIAIGEEPNMTTANALDNHEEQFHMSRKGLDKF